MTGKTAQKTGTTAQTASRQTARTEKARAQRQPQRPAEAAGTAAKTAAKKRASTTTPARQAKKVMRLRHANLMRHNVDAIIVFTVEHPRSLRAVGRDQRFECEWSHIPEGKAVAKKVVAANLFDVDILTFGEAISEALRVAGEQGAKSIALTGKQLVELDAAGVNASLVLRAIANLLVNQEAVRRVDIVCISTEEYAQLNRFVEEAEKEGEIGARVNVPVRRQFSRQVLRVYAEWDGFNV